jgi:hypothetical protein
MRFTEITVCSFGADSFPYTETGCELFLFRRLDPGGGCATRKTAGYCRSNGIGHSDQETQMTMSVVNHVVRASGIAVLFLAATTATTAWAAPSISSVAGVAEAGARVTVNGAGFGTKATAGPLVFDDFESGQSGQGIAGKAPSVRNISTGWTWGRYGSGSNVPEYSSQIVRPNSTRSSRHVFGGTSYNVSLEIISETPNTGDEIYFSFWRYHQKTSAAWSRNVKPWMVYGSSGDLPTAYDGWGSPSSGDGEFRNNTIDSGTTSNTLWGGPHLDAVEGQWIRIEGYLKQSSPTSTNGAFQIWVHQTATPSIALVQSSTAYRTRSTSNYWRQWHFGSYHATDDPASATANIYLDDLYFDQTRARIEIGNAARWSDCSHRELQIPAAWSNNSIEFTVTPGSFNAGSPVYLYVVDAQGVVNEQGYPVTLGQGSPAPEAPQNITVQ